MSERATDTNSSCYLADHATRSVPIVPGGHEKFGEGTPLFSHICACCGDPIATRHEAICKSIIAIDAMVHNSDVDGEFTTIYCPACLIDALEFSDIDTKNEIGSIMDQFWINSD